MNLNDDNRTGKKRDIEIGTKWTEFGIEKHIFNIITEDGIELVLYKFFDKSKERWFYRCDRKLIIEATIEYVENKKRQSNNVL